MKFSIIKYLDLKSSMRFNGSYHLSDGTLYLNKLRKMPYDELDVLSEKIFTAGRKKRVYTKEKFGYPYLSNSDIVQLNPLDGCKYNSKKYGYDESSFLKEGMIVTGRVGAIGQTAYISSEYEEYNAMGSDNIIRIVLNKKNLSGYVFAFLASKYGKTLLLKLAAGGVQPYISEDMIRDMPIPKLSEDKQQKIHKLIVKSGNLRTQANKLLKESICSIEKQIALRYGAMSAPITAIRNVKDLFLNEKRIDASYNSGIGRLINDTIVNDTHTTIAKLSDVFHPMLFGKKQLKGTPEKGNALYKSSSMVKVRPESNFWLSLKKVDTYDKLKVNEGWILVSRTGTVGSIVRVGKSMDNCFIDDHMIRVDPKQQYAGLLFCYLKCFYGQKLIAFQKYGSVQEVINSEYIGRIPVPEFLLESEGCDELNKNVQLLSDCFDKAYSHESEAVKLIEKEIEKWEK